MTWLIIQSILLGCGLAMDAFSVSVANGLAEGDMSRKRRLTVAGVFGAFQMLMPLLGLLLVRTVAAIFQGFSRLVPWVALILLSVIGVKMIFEALHPDGSAEKAAIRFGELLLQGVATSLDALSVGLTLGDRTIPEAVLSAGIIGAVTFGICLIGLYLGRKLGEKTMSRAVLFGGIILILVGIEIFVKGLLAL